jgi:hypothetical protein
LATSDRTAHFLKGHGQVHALEEDMRTLPLVFSCIAVIISCIALWKTHFARFSPLALAGNLQHRLYPIRNGEERWYITSFDVPVSITNPGAKPGIVTGLRLHLHYPELPFAGNYEFIRATSDLKPDKLRHINENRFNWLDEVVASHWSPFVVLPKATVAKHFLFETRWDKPVVQDRITATLELQIDGRDAWSTVTEWEIVLSPRMWVTLVNGGGMYYVPVNTPLPVESECFPEDLHKHTGAKTPLPTEGLVPEGDISYLDYPESKDE